MFVAFSMVENLESADIYKEWKQKLTPYLTK